MAFGCGLSHQSGSPKTSVMLWGLLLASSIAILTTIGIVLSMDEAAFSAYVAVRRPQLFRTACLLCGDAHRAEDIVQDALTKLYGAWDRVSRMIRRTSSEE